MKTQPLMARPTFLRKCPSCNKPVAFIDDEICPNCNHHLTVWQKIRLHSPIYLLIALALIVAALILYFTWKKDT
jgi:uncharacterized paraquat-inducible protein A